MAEIETRTKTIGMSATPSEAEAFCLAAAENKIKPAELLRLILAKVFPDRIEAGKRTVIKRVDEYAKATRQEVRALQREGSDDEEIAEALGLPLSVVRRYLGTTKEIHVRLAEHEEREVALRAKRDGTTRPGWVRKVVRAALHRSPQFSEREELALLESNRELAALGRNINQIAHQLNISLNAADLVNAQLLRDLDATIQAHRDKVYALINANWGRYGDGSDYE